VKPYKLQHLLPPVRNFVAGPRGLGRSELQKKTYGLGPILLLDQMLDTDKHELGLGLAHSRLYLLLFLKQVHSRFKGCASHITVASVIFLSLTFLENFFHT
jgi:hypothetical protein